MCPIWIVLLLASGSPGWMLIVAICAVAVLLLDIAWLTYRNGLPDVVLADAGYWHHVQMERLLSEGITVLIPPDAKKRAGALPDWDGAGFTPSCVASWRPTRAAAATPSARR